SRGTQEEPNEDESMPPQPPRRYGLRWVMEQEMRTMCGDNIPSHLYDMQMLQLRMSKVKEDLRNPLMMMMSLMRRLYLEFDDNGDDSKMTEASFSPTNDED
ncbi:hypothetical protein HAX54_041822, partial [Datura stramonium]|nr:hypothetical protein [Datura stramonium]